MRSGDKTTTGVSKDSTTVQLIDSVYNFGKVTDHIWRGAQPTAAGYHNLVERGGVRAFLNLRRGVDRDTADLNPLNEKNVQCYQVSLQEWNPRQDNLKRLALAVKTIRRLSENPQTRPVYVHCKGGRNRTGYVVATYRMVYQGWTADEAIREMRAYHFDRVYYRDEWFLKNLDVPHLREVIKEVE